MHAEKIHTKQDLLEVLFQHSAAIKSYGVRSLGLFGSFIKETNTEQSDVDFLVDFEPSKKSFDNFMDLSFFLEDLLGRKVELVTPQSLSKFIGPHILREVQDVSL
ncbi:nucleotidyltransferase [Sandaracinomonas limnophila]|uniref:Nucleotidyltransferase n=1 Tax=Sandaracinomonas limnophila TaxID=1862386 RepID=A0A437PPQ9_9BACT|nr:nucleotidyltransferase family protein [Sandaracinomonas limnophila]RVU24149.1 nucleotidyltransferase [Sandaracinomonas limnophila]